MGQFYVRASMWTALGYGNNVVHCGVSASDCFATEIASLIVTLKNLVESEFFCADRASLQGAILRVAGCLIFRVPTLVLDRTLDGLLFICFVPSSKIFLLGIGLSRWLLGETLRVLLTPLLGLATRTFGFAIIGTDGRRSSGLSFSLERTPTNSTNETTNNRLYGWDFLSDRPMRFESHVVLVTEPPSLCGLGAWLAVVILHTTGLIPLSTLAN